MTRNIFISYRRSDAKSEARSICQRLEKTFGKRSVFIDVDSINPGENFQSVLKVYLEKCNAMIVIIGSSWLELLKPSGRAANETSNDYVQMEVASALERKLPVLPILVDGAAMPDAGDLPDDLKPLALRQALFIRHESFSSDMWVLERELHRILPKRGAWKMAVISGSILILVGVVSYYVWWQPNASAKAYSSSGNFACINDAKYPDSWRGEAALCVPFGCNFGKMPREDCLALGARKRSKTVIHGNLGTTQANACWLQHSCGDLRPHSEFTLFKM